MRYHLERMIASATERHEVAVTMMGASMMKATAAPGLKDVAVSKILLLRHLAMANKTFFAVLHFMKKNALAGFRCTQPKPLRHRKIQLDLQLDLQQMDDGVYCERKPTATHARTPTTTGGTSCSQVRQWLWKKDLRSGRTSEPPSQSKGRSPFLPPSSDHATTLRRACSSVFVRPCSIDDT